MSAKMSSATCLQSLTTSVWFSRRVSLFNGKSKMYTSKLRVSVPSAYWLPV